MSKDVYDYLAKESVSELSITNLDSSTSSTAVDRTNVTFWGGPITLARVMEATRTYAHGIVIPEAGTIGTVSMAPGESATLQPPGTEVWHIKGIVGTGVGGTATCSVSWTDGTETVNIDNSQSMTTSGLSQFIYSATPPMTGSQPLTLTNSLYLKFEETGGAQGVIFHIAYHKVGL